MSDENQKIDELRRQLKKVDREILSLVKKRLEMVKKIGRAKSEGNLPTRDYEQEKRVIDRGRNEARSQNLDPDLAEDLLLRLINASLQVQEQDRMSQQSPGSGNRVLIIGGGGEMGRWFTRFLTSQDYNVEIADPSSSVEGVISYDSLSSTNLSHDYFLITTPIRRTRKILKQLTDRQPDGLVFDIASVKEPIADELHEAVDAGLKVTSIHPMFGPDTDLLSDQHVAFIDLGVEGAVDEAKRLFEGTMARLVDMELKTHDRVIAYVLGLSHALNICFSAALSESNCSFEELNQMASTTFSDQVDVAREVVSENPHLYYEIQALNEYNPKALHTFEQVFNRFKHIVNEEAEHDFVDLMEQGRKFLVQKDRRDRSS